MKLFGVILKLIQVLGLCSSEEYQQLYNDVKEWELTATKDNKDKLKAMYFKLHEGVFFRLLTPFIYFIALKEVRSLMNNDQDEDFNL